MFQQNFVGRSGAKKKLRVIIMRGLNILRRWECHSSSVCPRRTSCGDYVGMVVIIRHVLIQVKKKGLVGSS
jgi:hypothetical protein